MFPSSGFCSSPGIDGLQFKCALIYQFNFLSWVMDKRISYFCKVRKLPVTSVPLPPWGPRVELVSNNKSWKNIFQYFCLGLQLRLYIWMDTTLKLHWQSWLLRSTIQTDALFFGFSLVTHCEKSEICIQLHWTEEQISRCLNVTCGLRRPEGAAITSNAVRNLENR